MTRVITASVGLSPCAGRCFTVSHSMILLGSACSPQHTSAFCISIHHRRRDKVLPLKHKVGVGSYVTHTGCGIDHIARAGSCAPFLFPCCKQKLYYLNRYIHDFCSSVLHLMHLSSLVAAYLSFKPGCTAWPPRE